MNRTRTLPLFLPDELMEIILLKLPVRCLLRLKSVCKSWFSLISDPQFAKSHFDLAAAPTHRFLLKFCNDSESEGIFADIEDDLAQVVFKIPNPSPTPIPKRMAEDVLAQILWNTRNRNPSPAPVPKRRADVVGSCRGFLLLTYESSKFIYFVIWNPSTGVQKRFNKVWSWSTRSYVCGIGYDSLTDDYVVVTVTFPLFQRGQPPPGRCTAIHCFSSRTNSWSCTQVTAPYKNIGDIYGHGLFLNGALHWLVYSYDISKKIIAFDVMERRLSEIPLPHELAHQFYNLMVMGGCISLSVVPYGTIVAEIWMMKEYKVQSSWTKSFVLSTTTNSYPFNVFVPMCFTKNGDILGNDAAKTSVRINQKGELLEHRTHGLFNRLLHCGMYRESLLSLPGN